MENRYTQKGALKRIANLLGLTMTDLAKKLGVSRSFLYALKDGKKGAGHNLAQRLHEISGLAWEDIFNGGPGSFSTSIPATSVEVPTMELRYLEGYKLQAIHLDTFSLLAWKTQWGVATGRAHPDGTFELGPVLAQRIEGDNTEFAFCAQGNLMISNTTKGRIWAFSPEELDSLEVCDLTGYAYLSDIRSPNLEFDVRSRWDVTQMGCLIGDHWLLKRGSGKDRDRLVLFDPTTQKERLLDKGYSQFPTVFVRNEWWLYQMNLRGGDPQWGPHIIKALDLTNLEASPKIVMECPKMGPLNYSAKSGGWWAWLDRTEHAIRACWGDWPDPNCAETVAHPGEGRYKRFRNVTYGQWHCAVDCDIFGRPWVVFPNTAPPGLVGAVRNTKGKWKSCILDPGVGKGIFPAIRCWGNGAIDVWHHAHLEGSVRHTRWHADDIPPP
ncbi:hypothetical protein H8D30_04295 [bacterium]|nr:hypothetical protein [bacterium]